MANMTTNNESSQQREPRNGAQQPEAEAQSTMAKATALAADLATKQVKKTRDRFDDQISQQREQIAGRVRTLGRALRGTGEMLEEDDMVARALHYASEKVDGVAGYVTEITPTRVADDLRGIAQSKPWWFYGGAFAMGLALGRFARSTSEGEAAPSASMSVRTRRNGEDQSDQPSRAAARRRET